MIVVGISMKTGKDSLKVSAPMLITVSHAFSEVASANAAEIERNEVCPRAPFVVTLRTGILLHAKEVRGGEYHRY